MTDDQFDVWSIVLPAMAMVFAAFVVWLTVRIVNRRERWAKWTAVIVGVPALYVLSFGPACWISERTRTGNEAVSIAYQPMLRLLMHRTVLSSIVSRYAMAGTKDAVRTISRDRTDGWLTIHWYGMQN